MAQPEVRKYTPTLVWLGFGFQVVMCRNSVTEGGGTQNYGRGFHILDGYSGPKEGALKSYTFST